MVYLTAVGRVSMNYRAYMGWLGSVVVGRRTSDRKIASSTPGRALPDSLGQLSLPSTLGR